MENRYIYTVGIMAGESAPAIFDNEADAREDGATHLRQVEAYTAREAIRHYEEDIIV